MHHTIVKTLQNRFTFTVFCSYFELFTNLKCNAGWENKTQKDLEGVNLPTFLAF
jgi:hypothetical protein